MSLYISVVDAWKRWKVRWGICFMCVWKWTKQNVQLHFAPYFIRTFRNVIILAHWTICFAFFIAHAFNKIDTELTEQRLSGWRNIRLIRWYNLLTICTRFNWTLYSITMFSLLKFNFIHFSFLFLFPCSILCSIHGWN